MGRRTKAQIAQDNYIAEVNEYRFFIYQNNNFHCGYEFKEDAKEVMEDYVDGKLYTFRTAVTAGLGDKLNEAINRWKTM